jgi:hypothetical protein
MVSRANLQTGCLLPKKISGEVSKASFARISREQQFIVSMLRRRDTVSSFQLVFME